MISKTLLKRAGNCCELCKSSDNLSAFEVSPSDGSDEQSVCLCINCKTYIQNTDTIDEVHFNCLNDSMWSSTPAVVVLSYRILNYLNRQDLIDMIYFEDELKRWADSKSIGLDDDNLVYKDANGVILNTGDTVVITKDLNVKGTGFTAKRGTAVRNIALVHGDSEHIEGRVNGVKIHILTKFLKKS